MTAFDHTAFYGELRRRWGPLKQAQVDDINAALAKAWELPSVDPAWMVVARKLIGTTEIPGPQHNNVIVNLFARVGYAIYKTDEVAWCGAFIGACFKDAGIAIPKTAPRALDWATWGVECEPQVGAVCVMEREGGGHVTFAAGRTAAGAIKGLGGNQRNQVNISDFPFDRITDWRWPSGVPQAHIPLPIMAPGIISRNER
ncbi:TIGR02594 family protein [Rhizorhabdus histidinilytica]|uniref:TIGR02594 family protein n=1 Tax=Rhizorhabdus histidinilytica TaxID=439228 RepID=A0A1T5A780_9SPHN|nr:TIGR02594 family protein [Rhizorhabdus histidinilytica]SKB30776.1 TIGR02594 family protein [Rhizorhabdus histidinilytica]